MIFLEAQTVGGYSSKESEPVYYSNNRNDAMQKPSLGFDYIEKLSNDYQDLATIAIQGRLAYDKSYNKWEPQLYNAYVEAKTSVGGDLWLGSNRPAFLLGSYWDTHAELLQPLSMEGFGFGRDWGVGYTKYLDDGDFKASMTSGSGQSFRTEGNYLAALRYGKGVINFDNYNVGLSLANGRTLKTMGYHVEDHKPKDFRMIGFDGSYNFNNVEQKAEFAFGEKQDKASLGVLYRLTLKFLEDDKLKLDFQPSYTKNHKDYDKTLSFGTTYKVSSETAVRFMYSYSEAKETMLGMTDKSSDNVILGQIYYYFRWK